MIKFLWQKIKFIVKKCYVSLLLCQRMFYPSRYSGLSLIYINLGIKSDFTGASLVAQW